MTKSFNYRRMGIQVFIAVCLICTIVCYVYTEVYLYRAYGPDCGTKEHEMDLYFKTTATSQFALFGTLAVALTAAFIVMLVTLEKSTNAAQLKREKKFFKIMIFLFTVSYLLRGVYMLGYGRY